MRPPTALLIPILALAVACKSGGSGPTEPIEPTYRLVMPPPCQTQPPVDPGPVLRGIPSCGDGADGSCPLSPGQSDALWTYLEALEDYAWSSWRCEERRANRAIRGVPGGSGEGANAADP